MFYLICSTRSLSLSLSFFLSLSLSFSRINRYKNCTIGLEFCLCSRDKAKNRRLFHALLYLVHDNFAPSPPTFSLLWKFCTLALKMPLEFRRCVCVCVCVCLYASYPIFSIYVCLQLSRNVKTKEKKPLPIYSRDICHLRNDYVRSVHTSYTSHPRSIYTMRVSCVYETINIILQLTKIFLFATGVRVSCFSPFNYTFSSHSWKQNRVGSFRFFFSSYTYTSLSFSLSICMFVHLFVNYDVYNIIYI